MLTLPLLVASLSFSHSVVGSRHKKQDAQQVQALKEPCIDAEKMYLIRVQPQIMKLQSACSYLSDRCETLVGPNLKPDFSCSSAGQPVVPTSPYLWASCLAGASTNEKAGCARDVSFNAFAGSDDTIVFLRGDEALREVEIDQHLLSIESKKWKPTVNHHPRDRSPTTKRHHHRQTNHGTTGPKTHSGHNGDRPKRHKQET